MLQSITLKGVILPIAPSHKDEDQGQSGQGFINHEKRALTAQGLKMFDRIKHFTS